jgi:SAM-dependent methyltransferase
MDPRAAEAPYYDLNPGFPPDEDFYIARLPTEPGDVLELGCGTGRLSLSLARPSRYYEGVDLSPAMASLAREKLREAGFGPDRARITIGDMTRLQLDRQFDLILGPFRVLQNLATEAELHGLFSGLRGHLATDGRIVVNAFNPNRAPAAMLETWSSSEESLEWVVPVEGGRVARSFRRARVQPDPLVLYPDIVYRRFAGDLVVEESVLSLAMRCWYPEELLARIAAEGFRVTQTWGGFAGEPYGVGPELLVEFCRAA